MWCRSLFMQVHNMSTGCDCGPVNVSLPSPREQNATTFTCGAPAGFSSWSTFQFNGRISHGFVHLGPCWKENDGQEGFPRYKIKSDLHLQLSLSQTAECESCILMRLWAQRRVAPPPPSSTLLRFCSSVFFLFFLALRLQRRQCAALHPALSRPCFSRGRGASRLLLHLRDV